MQLRKLSKGLKAAYRESDAHSRVKHFDGWMDRAHGDGARPVGYDHAETVKEYYDLCSEFMVFGWGESLHFAPLSPMESLEDSKIRHQRLMISKLELREGMTVIDVGCGIGGPMRRVVREGGGPHPADIFKILDGHRQSSERRIAESRGAGGCTGPFEAQRGQRVDARFDRPDPVFQGFKQFRYGQVSAPEQRTDFQRGHADEFGNGGILLHGQAGRVRIRMRTQRPGHQAVPGSSHAHPSTGSGWSS